MSCGWAHPSFPVIASPLKLYPQDGTAALQIPLAEIVWVEREWVGVEFLRLSQEAKAKLQRFCSESVTLAVGDSIPAMLPPGVYVEEVDPSIPVMLEVTKVTLRTGFEQWCKQELRWLMFEQNGPRIWGQAVQNIRTYLFELWAREALQGARAQEAFFVKCDLTTMTPDDLREGTLICLVGAAPVKPAEFIRYRIRIQLKPR